jgi:hypothetical protein
MKFSTLNTVGNILNTVQEHFTLENALTTGGTALKLMGIVRAARGEGEKAAAEVFAGEGMVRLGEYIGDMTTSHDHRADKLRKIGNQLTAGAALGVTAYKMTEQ